MNIPTWQERIDRTAEKVEYGDLYRALHYVHDGDTKIEIENALREILDEVTFRKVAAIFKIATTNNIPNF